MEIGHGGRIFRSYRFRRTVGSLVWCPGGLGCRCEFLRLPLICRLWRILREVLCKFEKGKARILLEGSSSGKSDLASLTYRVAARMWMCVSLCECVCRSVSVRVTLCMRMCEGGRPVNCHFFLFWLAFALVCGCRFTKSECGAQNKPGKEEKFRDRKDWLSTNLLLVEQVF